ncbi:MAG: dual specificity protein phosphatase family protein [Bacteriovoracaceae bacterium]
MNFAKYFLLIIFSIGIFSGQAKAENNLHLIDSDPTTGFAIYRYSKPDKNDMKMLCDLGIEEVVVLSGTATKHEYKYQTECPTLKVVYNEEQSTKVPVTAQFLTFFDSWVEDAKVTGKKIAFRCECGCHRTGRLAAYYQMKYQKLTTNDATVIMMKHGKWMWTQPQLVPQVRDLANFIQEKPCEESEKYCVIRD